VRYALGYRHLGDGYFDLRTLYYFRERLARHMQETGENPQAFEQVTDDCGRSPSRPASSGWIAPCWLPTSGWDGCNLVTVLQRVWRMLSEEDQQRYATSSPPI
jgi:hypothetical protein